MPAIYVSVDGALDSYNDLLSAITDETDGRADSTALSRFVRMAESDIRRALAREPVRPMRTRTDLTVDAEYVLAPTTMVRPISVELSDGTTTRRVPFIESETVSRRKVVASAFPEFFTREGDYLRFSPTPDVSYTGQLLYFDGLTALDSSNQTNWLFAEYPDIYLNGGLYYAYRYQPDIEKAALMKGLFDEGLMALAGAYPEPPSEAVLTVDVGLLAARATWQTL